MGKKESGFKILTPERGGLYVHVAYCRRKCIYCDFFSAGERIADWHRYVDALSAEFKKRISEVAYPLRTVYFGGGTPSLMPCEEFVRLCNVLKPYMGGVEEFTIEVNPDDVDDLKLGIWRSAGVNRLSMGIQSLDDNVLSSLGRLHNASSARKAYEMSRQYFRNISIDLIFGLPGQSEEMWAKDLKEVVEMHPEHISAYSLMYEEGTALTVLRDKGRIEESSDISVENMFHILIEELKRAGYEHYETSNFALPGFRSRHNSSYWRQSPYLGLGPSAHSYDGFRERKANIADIRAYLDYWTSKDDGIQSPFISKMTDVAETEILGDEELREEYIMTRLRTREGIDMEDYRFRFGMDEYNRLLSRSLKWIKDGCMKKLDGNLALSEQAILISDSIILDLA